MSRVCVLAEHEVAEFIKSDGRRTEPKKPDGSETSINHEAHEHISFRVAEALTREPVGEREGKVIFKARWVPAWTTEAPTRLAIAYNDPYYGEWRKKSSGGFAVRQLVRGGVKAMKFTEKDRRDLEREFEETRFPQSHMANLIGVSNAYMSGFLSGLRQPTEENLRQMYCVLGVVREEYRTNGGFALNQKNMAMLRKRLAETEKSIVRRAQVVEDNDGEEREKCRATVN